MALLDGHLGKICENFEKSIFHHKNTILSMGSKLVIGTTRKDIKSTTYVNAYIDLRYQLSGKS